MHRFSSGRLLAILTAFAASAGAQSGNAEAPPAPVAPATMSVGANGQKTIRAIKLAQPLKLDGVLDEEVYTREQPFDGLIQVAPDWGKPASEKSDIWVTYDHTHIYVTCRCYDTSPPGEWIVNELRRDTGGLRNNEHFGVLFDTYYDRRSGFAFYTNPLGARADYSIVDEGSSNTDWNPVWTSKTGRFDGGWIAEMAIPLKSLRFKAGDGQVWGFQIRRSIRHKNEWAYLTPVPRILAGPQALNRVSAAGTLVALDLPSAGKNIELKPYGIARSTTDNLRSPKLKDDVTSDFGGDIKYAVTPNLTADLTFNTDFAQVEIDEQQVNLTRFNLSFPEKRDFFLEGRGTFDFGRGGTGFNFTGQQSDAPQIFYTRRIGLNNGRVIPIDAGGRLTGKLGKYAIGLMNIRTADEPTATTKATDFTVVRLKRDVLSRSAIGILATNRSVAASGTGSNLTYGMDGSFLLSQALTVNSYWARSNTTGVSGKDQSYQGSVDYGVDRYGARAEFLSVGANFDPQVGFRRRSDFNRSSGQLRFSPRPTGKSIVRKYTFTGGGEYVETGAGAVETRGFDTQFESEFENSDRFSVNASHTYEFLRASFSPSGSASPIGAGGYTYRDATIAYSFGPQRRVSGNASFKFGEYYNGHIRSLTLGTGMMTPARVVFSSRLAMEPTIQIVQVDLPGNSFTTRLARARVDYGFSPLMFASGLFQYNSADRAFSTNLRFRWEYAPGSELFLVYTDERDMTSDALATPTTVRGLKNRALVVKINKLFRY